MKAPLQSGTQQTFAFFKHNMKAVLKNRQILKVGSEDDFQFQNEHVQQVFRKALQQSKGVSVTCYLDGKKVAGDKTVNQSLRRLSLSKDWETGLRCFPYSVQIRNAHKLSPQLYQFCQAFGQFMNWEYYLNVNLYMTPGLKRNCFEFHTDPHPSMIYQVQGQKKWLFPIQDSAYVSSHNPLRPLPKFNSRRLKTHLMQEQDWLFIPEGAIHKAEIQGDEPSIHLTFSLLTNRTHQGLADIFTWQIENTLDIQSLKFKNLDDQQMNRMLEKLGAEMRGLFDRGKINKWVQARNMMEFKNDLGINRPK